MFAFAHSHSPSVTTYSVVDRLAIIVSFWVPFFPTQFDPPQRRSTTSGSPRKPSYTLLSHQVFNVHSAFPRRFKRANFEYTPPCTRVWSATLSLQHNSVARRGAATHSDPSHSIRHVLFQHISILCKAFRQLRILSHAEKVELCAVWFASRFASRFASKFGRGQQFTRTPIS